ncbi:MAG: glycosyl hydrolase family 28-related protein [Verrucomicrobiota bacterium]
MTRYCSFVCIAAALLCSAFAQAPWRSTLYPTTWSPPTTLLFESDKMIQDFSYAGYRRGDAPIPTIAGPIFNVTSYGADPTGTSDSTSAIQAAINAAGSAGGGVVYMPAGTFKVAPSGANTYALLITSNNIVLRGAGTGQTFLFNDSPLMRSKNIIRVLGSSSTWSTVPAGSPQPTITSNLLSPTTSIPVSSVTGFAVNDWVILRADATDAFIAEHNMADVWAGMNSTLGGPMFLRKITAIDATNLRLTVDVPIRYYLKTRDNARVHKAVAHVEEVGLEDFSIGNREHANSSLTTGWGENDHEVSGTGAYDVHASYAVQLTRARNCWISNIATYRPMVNTKDAHILSNGVLLDNCRGVTVRHCDFQRPLYGGGGGNGYMYRIQRTNESLLTDCAARFNRHPFVFSHMSTSGNVIHGGIAQVSKMQAVTPAFVVGEGSDHHMFLSQSNLMDGVQMDQDFFTAHYRGTAGGPSYHGQTAVHSVYWNTVGLAYHQSYAWIVRSEQARYGYIIGSRGPFSAITTTGIDATRTAPADHSEGQGTGTALQPLSLYHDQLTRRLGAAPVPPAPTALAATSADAEIALSWNASSSATSYKIYRSTTPGGPYAFVASATGTTYSDYGVFNGSRYFYVVAATNAAGDSGYAYEATATANPPLLQSSASQGLLAVEAENYDANIGRGGHAWTAVTNAGYSGSGGLQAGPNRGSTRDANYLTLSPRLDFRVNFVKTGTHYVWIRGIAPTGSDDTVHVGLNNTASSTSDRISMSGTTWTWRNATTDGPVATLTIATTGVHTVNLWMREDAVMVDKVVLTTDAAYVPSGFGPAESARPSNLPAAIFDTFEDGNATGWTADGGTWAVVVSGTQAYRQSVHTTGAVRSTLDATAGWKTQVVEADVKLNSVDGANRFFGLVARHNGPNDYYYFVLRTDNTIELKKNVGGTATTIASGAFTVTIGTWYSLKLEAIGTTLRAYIDGQLKLQGTDSQFTSGKAGMVTFRTSVDFDDVYVDATPNNPVLVADDFQDGNATGWTPNAGSTWSVVTDGSLAYRQSNKLSATTTFSVTGNVAWTDQIMEADAKLISIDGTNRWLGLAFRYIDENNHYYVSFRTSNVLELKKMSGGVFTTLATTPLTLTTGTWYVIKAKAIGNSLKVYVDGKLQLQTTDSTFAAGKIGLALYKAEASYDDVVVTAP